MTSAIYRGMDQATLDAAYNNLAAVKDSANHLQEWSRQSKIVRAGAKAHLDLHYGPAPRNTIDYFACGEKQAPLFVFIHGGYWQRNSKDLFSFIAAGPRALGINVAVVGYTLAPEARLSDIVSEISTAIDFLHSQTIDLFFDANRMFIGGWSAGGHLAALAAHHTQVKGVLSISGIFDLEPIALSYINAKLRLEAAEVASLSPLHQIAQRQIPYLVYVGGVELPELQRQTTDFADALRAQRLTVELHKPEGLNHFTIVDQLVEADGLLTQALCRLIEMA